MAAMWALRLGQCSLFSSAGSPAQTQWVRLVQRHVSNGKGKGAVLIAAATRTPFGAAGGQLASLAAPALGAFAIEMAVKQVAMPREDLQRLILAGSDLDAMKIALKKDLHKSLSCSTATNGMNALIAGTEHLQVEEGAVIVANIQSTTCKEITESNEPKLSEHECRESLQRFNSACLAGIVEAEVTPVRIQEQRKAPLFITQDDMEITKSVRGYDGASALLLTTAETAARLDLKPLAQLLYFRQTTADATEVVAGLLECNGLQQDHIDRWEVDQTAKLQNYFQLDNSRINKYGHYPLAPIGPHTVVHLGHTMRPGGFGCVVAENEEGLTTALLIEKICTPNLGQQGKVPLFTLFTKDPCPLCDMLLEDLAQHLPDPSQYDLQKVYITEKTNLRYLRAYRYDIPVLFLNGRFLCMHKLNVKLLNRRLDELMS